MKIICSNNLNDETVSDKLVAENVNQYTGQKITDLLNKSDGEMSPYYYRLVENKYKLYTWEP